MTQQRAGEAAGQEWGKQEEAVHKGVGNTTVLQEQCNGGAAAAHGKKGNFWDNAKEQLPKLW